VAAVSKPTPLKERVKHGLDEILILITGAEILIGFQYTVAFNKGFNNLPQSSQYLQIIVLVLLLLTLHMIMLPVPYHLIVENGDDTESFCKFIRRAILITLFPFALSIGLDIFIVTQKVGGTVLGLVASVLAIVTALTFWYFIEYARRQIDGRAQMESTPNDNQPEQGDTKLADKVDHILTETRVVLPGAQALLGFQFATVFVDGFDQLSQTAKYLHLLSLFLIAISTILLMTPAAYHRIVERGEDTPHFSHLGGRIVLAAMVTLALGITINFYVVVAKVTRSPETALIGAGVMLVLFYGIWFGYTFYRRNHPIK
jgi:hypothetical protein